MRIVILILILLTNFEIISQYSVYMTNSGFGEDFSVYFSENTLLADLDVKIGENILLEDFTIGFTNNINNANVIIENNQYRADYTIKMSNSSFIADMSIKASETTILPDISIEIKKSGYVDYLVYNKVDDLDLNILVVALLPIINLELDYKYENIPMVDSDGNDVSKSVNVSVTEYCCPSLDHWIQSINDGVIILEDNSIWKVYDEDQFTSMLWLPIDDIIVRSTSSYGHYYLINNQESVRAMHISVD